jgi:CBS domain-containing protein
MSAADSSSKFLSIYNEIDHHMRKVLNVPSYTDHGTLLRQMSEKNRLFESYYKDLKLFAELRNLLVHNPYPDRASPLIIPHDYIIKRYNDIRSTVLHPKKAIDIAVKTEHIYQTSLDANVIEVMQAMNDKTYTHVPVVLGEKMIGVFSENTILTYLVQNKDAIIPKDTMIEEFKEFIGLDNHPSEYFEFVSRYTLLVDVETLFKKRLKERKRIAVVYVTEHGKKDEKLLGMITAWDVAGAV